MEQSIQSFMKIIETSGGWGMFAAATIIVGRWFVSRMDRLIDSMSKAVVSFEAFRIDLEKANHEMTRTQERLLSTLERIERHTNQ